jgi:hypothetical protein
MGAVYAARDTKLGRKVAIKFLYSDSNQPELTARFLIEAKATAQCSHENIIVIHEVGEHGGHPFMVLEYLQGAPLTQLVQDGRRLPPAQAVELIVPVVTDPDPASPGCTKDEVPTALNNQLTLARREQAAAVGAYIVGGSLIAAGVVLLYLNQPRTAAQRDVGASARSVTVTPAVTADTLGILVRVSH